jgi:hypothetical protein
LTKRRRFNRKEKRGQLGEAEVQAKEKNEPVDSPDLKNLTGDLLVF